MLLPFLTKSPVSQSTFHNLVSYSTQPGCFQMLKCWTAQSKIITGMVNLFEKGVVLFPSYQ